MTERSRNIAVGITALIGLGCLAAMMILFGDATQWFETGYVVRVAMQNANGISVGCRVHLDGIDVGRVTDVQNQTPLAGPASRPSSAATQEIEPSLTGPATRPSPALMQESMQEKGPTQGELDHWPVMVYLKIKKDIPLHQGVKVTVESPLIGGSPIVELSTSGVELGAVFTAGHIPILQGGSANLMETLTRQFQGPLKEAMAKFDQLNENFAKLSKEWTDVGKNINQLTRQVSPEEVDKGKAQGNLATVLARADKRLAELQVTLADVQKWVGDEKLHKDFSETVANANAMTARLGKTVDKIDDTVTTSRESIDKLTKRYVAVADDLSAAIASARQTIDQARTGDGTVGKLIKDPKLYDNLNDSVQRVDQAMKDFKLLIDKFRDEGIMLNMGG